MYYKLIIFFFNGSHKNIHSSLKETRHTFICLKHATGHMARAARVPALISHACQGKDETNDTPCVSVNVDTVYLVERYFRHVQK